MSDDVLARITLEPPHRPASLKVRCACGARIGAYVWSPGVDVDHQDRAWKFEDHDGRWHLDALQVTLTVECRNGHACEIPCDRAVGAIVAGVRTIRAQRAAGR